MLKFYCLRKGCKTYLIISLIGPADFSKTFVQSHVWTTVGGHILGALAQAKHTLREKCLSNLHHVWGGLWVSLFG